MGTAAAGEPFTHRSGVDEEQERDLVPPLAVDGSASVTVTMTLDAASWFIAPGSGLFDPRPGHPGVSLFSGREKMAFC